ncbi:hypothetical protein EJ08DRAFT_658083 [Tothia fuscella]|uniref:Uncharacterized protein n=1 Tax=Tothia fuscella TaxID=1048955 RepID=A0A9P4NXP5_9PEZI|nr:hypothetical protein EJ08DRAFT_658083 [Tothia fuscella]
MVQAMNLSVNDAKILNAVFDPESAPETPKITIDPLLPADCNITNFSLLTALRAQELSAIRLVEAYNPAEDSPTHKHVVYLKALHIISGLIADHPTYASAYNNRAQLRRWRFGDRDVLVGSQGNDIARSAIGDAVRDLAMAITLASPVPGVYAVSPAQGKLLAQAWTQKAAVYWGAAKDLEAEPRVFGKEWEGWDKTRFEEEGSRCFFMAGVFGSEVGKAMAVVSNPHARLCGSIVKEAMRRERFLGVVVAIKICEVENISRAAYRVACGA